MTRIRLACIALFALIALSACHTVEGVGKDIKSVYTTPVWVTTDNMADTVIKDNVLKTSDVCVASLADACKAAGIQ